MLKRTRFLRKSRRKSLPIKDVRTTSNKGLGIWIDRVKLKPPKTNTGSWRSEHPNAVLRPSEPLRYQSSSQKSNFALLG